MRKKVSLESIILFCHQLEIMSISGTSIAQSLTIMKASSKNKELRHLADSILDEAVKVNVQASEKKVLEVTFFEPLRRLKENNSPEITQKIMKQVRNDLVRKEKLNKNITRILKYPAAQFAILLGMTIILLTVVLPQFRIMFAEAHLQLPLITRFVIVISDFVTDNIYLLAVVLSILLLSLKKWAKLSFFSMLPFISPIMKKISYSQFFGYFSTFTLLGDSIDEAYLKASQSLSNQYYSHRLQKKQSSSSYTEKIGDSFGDPMIGAIVASGEKSNTFVETLNALADHYDTSAEEASQSFVSVIEPLIILTTGIVVGIIVIALYLPMFEMIDFIR